MVSLRELAIGYPNQLVWQISELEQKQSWQRAQQYSNPTTRCQAHLNYLCWQTFVPWLSSWLEEGLAESDRSKNGIVENIVSDSCLPERWEFVNGSLIELDEIKLVLIPSEASDLEEFDLPQEWIDIPQWQADYYLAIQLNLDDPQQSWMRVRGYVSHQQIRKKGEYEPSDRSYYISEAYLTEEISGIFYQPQTKSVRKLQLETGFELSAETANDLLNRLSDPAIYYPRLAIAVPHWQMLITNPQWRQKLYQQRTSSLGLAASWAQNIDLREWLQNLATTVSESWQILETLVTPVQPIAVRGYRDEDLTRTVTKDAITPLIDLLQPHHPEKERSQAAGVLGKIGAGHPDVIKALTELLHTAKEEDTRWEAALSLGRLDPGNPLAGITKGKIIDLGIQLENRQIVLIVAVAPKEGGRIGVWLQLKPFNPSTKLPANLRLEVVSEGNTLLEAASRSHPDGTGKDECVQLRFTPPTETNFQVRVTFNEVSFTESFVA